MTKAYKAQEYAFNMLTPKQQKVWSYVMQEGMSEARTGRVLRISRDAVHDRIMKAKKMYEQRVKNYLKGIR